jgi:signal transduction histidine kinase
MLGYFGAYRARSRHRFATLAAWPPAPASGNEPALLHDLLDHASQVLGTSRLLLIWRDRQSPDGKLVLFGPAGLACAGPLDPQFWQARAVSLSHNDLPPKVERTEIAAIASATAWRELSADLHDLRSASFSGARFIGRLYVLDSHYSHEDAAALEQITALRIGQELERFALTKAMADTARDQERVRLARDLHDGVLQNLTAATLKLRAAAATVPHEARQSLQSVSELMIEQQRSIRLFVEESRTMDVPTVHHRSPSLSQKVSELSNRWDCDIDLKITPPDMELPLPVLRELTRLLSEATANAVRHGGATRLNVELCRVGHGLNLTIADNGCGITASGDNPPWPRSLHARVEDLEGNLAITRYAPGLALRIEVPLP